MDLQSFTQSDTFELIIKHPITGEDTDIKIVLCGSDSKQYRAALSSLTETDSEKRGLELLALCTMAWENVEFKGKSVACSKESAIMIYTEVPFIMNDVNLAVFNRVNFMSSLGKKP